MQRDMNYLRELLTELVESDEWLHPIGLFDAPDECDSKRDYHVRLLCQEGFLERTQPGIYMVCSRGHDFLSFSAEKTIWEKAKATVAHLKNPSLTMLTNVAEAIAMKQINKALGIGL